jgi:hypothetical protein
MRGEHVLDERNTLKFETSMRAALAVRNSHFDHGGNHVCTSQSIRTD